MPRKKTHEEFVAEVYQKLGPDYEVLSQYTNAHGKVLMKHHKCGNTFEKNIHDIVTKGSGCPFCNGAKPSLYNEKWVRENTPQPYQYISGYVNMTTKCKFHCNVCNSDFLQSPARLINEHIYGCNCQSTKKLTHEDFLQRLGEECLKEYEILGKYINIDTPITFKHIPCGTIFELTPYQFITRHNKKYCPVCYYKKSHGEILIADFLTKNGFLYKKEYIFKDLPNRKFDYFLPELNIAIEFDGQQHYEFVEFFHRTIENFNLRQQMDIEKNQYCIKNNIPLYRIPYWEEEHISKILSQILLEKSSTTIEKFIVK